MPASHFILQLAFLFFSLKITHIISNFNGKCAYREAVRELFVIWTKFSSGHGHKVQFVLLIICSTPLKQNQVGYYIDTYRNNNI